MNRIIKTFPSFILGKCRCGCGKDIPIRSKQHGTIQFYIQFHHQRGKDHHNYKGGIQGGYKDYIRILSPNHPYKGARNTVAQHRLIMEHYYSIIFDEEIYLPFPKYDVHHIDGNVRNNSLINLELVTRKEHKQRHKKEINRNCLICNSNETYIDNRGTKVWFRYNNGYICRKCHRKRLKKLGKKNV